jgi:hypothetical protein
MGRCTNAVKLAMHTARRNLIVGLICGVLGAHYVAIAARLDHWPLSNYAMFARCKTSTASCLTLVGVQADGEEILLQASEYWRPQRGYKLAYTLQRLHQRDLQAAQRGASANSKVPATIESLMDHYESRRQAGLHDGPPLTGLRLYDTQWRIEPALSNLDRPTRRELVCEHVLRR